MIREFVWKPPHGTARVSKPEWSFRTSDVMKMIAMQAPYSAQNPDREGGDMARTTLRFRIIFDEVGFFFGPTTVGDSWRSAIRGSIAVTCRVGMKHANAATARKKADTAANVHKSVGLVA